VSILAFAGWVKGLTFLVFLVVLCVATFRLTTSLLQRVWPIKDRDPTLGAADERIGDALWAKAAIYASVAILFVGSIAVPFFVRDLHEVIGALLALGLLWWLVTSAVIALRRRSVKPLLSMQSGSEAAPRSHSCNAR
jgi:hypothetical protein